MAVGDLLTKALVPEHHRDDLARLASVSIEDTDELERRAAEARSGAPGIEWEDVKLRLERLPLGAARG